MVEVLKKALLDRIVLIKKEFFEKRALFHASGDAQNPEGNSTLRNEANHLGGRLAEAQHWLRELYPGTSELPDLATPQPTEDPFDLNGGKAG